MGEIDVTFLSRFISYDPSTGLFTRHTLCKADNNSSIGPLINKDSGGYIIFSVLGISYLAHRLAFPFMGLDMPDIVDHINRIRHDNRWVNLRSANKFTNAQNRGLGKNNRSGHPGVIYDKCRDKYRTYCRINGRQYTAGRFDIFDDAVTAIDELKTRILKG
jgi:hypothetical protein